MIGRGRGPSDRSALPGALGFAVSYKISRYERPNAGRCFPMYSICADSLFSPKILPSTTRQISPKSLPSHAGTDPEKLPSFSEIIHSRRRDKAAQYRQRSRHPELSGRGVDRQMIRRDLNFAHFNVVRFPIATISKSLDEKARGSYARRHTASRGLGHRDGLDCPRNHRGAKTAESPPSSWGRVGWGGQRTPIATNQDWMERPGARTSTSHHPTLAVPGV